MSEPYACFGKFIEVTIPSAQVTSDGNQEYFSEENIYWTPASNITDLYEQLAHHKHRDTQAPNKIKTNKFYSAKLFSTFLFHLC